MDRQCAPEHAGLHIALDSLLSAAALALAVLLYQILLQRHHINIAVIAVIVIAMWQLKMISMILFIGWQCVIYVSSITFARIDAGAQPFKKAVFAQAVNTGAFVFTQALTGAAPCRSYAICASFRRKTIPHAGAIAGMWDSF